MIGGLRNIGRLLGLARKLARHDILFPLEQVPSGPLIMALAKLLARPRGEGRVGERLALAFTELGPGFIKLGQALSTRSDLLGEEMAADLSALQDRLPPFSGTEARATIEHELGATLDELFTQFDDTALAAASIAQVHLAITTDGREVAVKVLRPGVEQAFAADLDLLYWVARLVERHRPELCRLKLVEIIDTFEESVRLEMDLRLEAAAAEELAENFAGDPSFNVPAIDWGRTAKRVLTLERVRGTPIDQRDTLLAQGHDPDEILRITAAAFLTQVFRDGFFHADQHPGNIFVQEDGSIVAVDFGIMGRLDKPTRRYLGEMLMSFLTRDYRRVAEVHFEAGYVPADKSVQAFTQACRSIAEPILDKPQNEISFARLMAHLFQVTETFEMETQPQLLLLQKTMLVAEGVGRKLSPEANMWFLAQPLVEQWVIDNLGPEARLRQLRDQMADSVKRLPRIVSDVEKGAAAFSRDGLKLHPDTLRRLNAAESHGRPIAPSVYLGVILFLLVLLILV